MDIKGYRHIPKSLFQAITFDLPKRWSIEDMCNQLKNRWGWKKARQQSRQVLHRWTQILSTSLCIASTVDSW